MWDMAFANTFGSATPRVLFAGFGDTAHATAVRGFFVKTRSSTTCQVWIDGSTLVSGETYTVDYFIHSA
jgi:hypothetical protein